MTDKEKLDKVVAEIERMKSQWQNGCSSEAKYRLEMLNDVLDFINSMQEEPINDDLDYAINEYVHDSVEKNGVFTGDEVSRMVERAIEFGAKLEKEQFERNRLAACDAQTEQEANIEQDFVIEIIKKEHRQPTYNDAIKYGMKLQREQMMKDAVDGLIFAKLEDGSIMARSNYFKSGIINYLDNVKLIIVKED